MAGTGRRISWGPVLVVVLAIIVGVLVFLALRPPTPPTTVVTDPPAATATESASPTPEPTPEPTSTAAAPVVPARERPVDVQSATVAARAVAGACPGGGALVELTRDGGTTWVGVDTPADEVLRVSWNEGPDLWFVGATGNCAPGFWRSEDEGSTWAAPTDAAGAWHLLPDPASQQLHAPDGDVDSPCGASGTLELESLPPDGALVLCGDGRIAGSSDSGATWQQVAAATGALALGVVDGQPVVVQPGGEGCTGLSVGSPLVEERTCVGGAVGQGVGLAFAGPDAGYLVAGDITWVSSDRGVTWEQR
jgi:hypothetical protein